MPRIADVVCSPGLTGFFFDDQRAIKKGAHPDGFFYEGQPVTPGFRSIRMAGESISVMLMLDDGRMGWGDCAAIQYSGAGGRYPAFIARDFIPVIDERIAPILKGVEPTSFRELAGRVDDLRDDEGAKIHSAIRYGVTQAILDAVAAARGLLPCEVVAEEYGLELTTHPVPIFSQSGDDRYTHADQMIIKRADVMPHALINNVPDKLGQNGEKLLAYVEWLRDRILTKRADETYNPQLHIDVYGTVGIAFDNDVGRMGAYLSSLGEAAEPFSLRIEGPVDAGGRDAQCAALLALRTYLKDNDAPVEIVADEWCNNLDDIHLFVDRGAVDMIQIKTPGLGGIQNTIEALLYCKKAGMRTYLGGTCNETDRSAQLCVHVALAVKPDQMLAKPGMGVDEGFMIVNNEMRRTLALLERKRRA
jgi:methylaspartate ammonia-lyase